MLLDHKYTIYIFSEGVVRTSSERYDATDLRNITSHLTNHCIQVNNDLINSAPFLFNSLHSMGSNMIDNTAETCENNRMVKSMKNANIVQKP